MLIAFDFTATREIQLWHKACLETLLVLFECLRFTVYSDPTCLTLSSWLPTAQAFDLFVQACGEIQYAFPWPAQTTPVVCFASAKSVMGSFFTGYVSSQTAGYRPSCRIESTLTS
jgi:hypothetical protein